MRWIFHIGAGKTGTSSLQFTLRDSRPALAAAGVWYLGLMLEHAPVRHFEWQVFGGTELFHRLPQAEGERQLRVVVEDTVQRAQAAGIHTLVWSSESFFDRYDKAIPPLQALVARGHTVDIVAYVRRHDAWVRSAYVQWGIKHKTTPGPVLPFKEWVARRRPFFAPTLRDYERAFPGHLHVRNLDQAGDAVGDFLRWAGLDHLSLPHVRDNVTPDNAEVLLRAVFNTGIREPALPMLFQRVIGRHASFDQTPDEYLSALLPDAADLRQVRQDCVDDREAINHWLARSGQQPLASDDLALRPSGVSTERLVMGLAQLCVFQTRRMEALERRLTALEGAAEERPAATGG
jgi:hypothetical protein